MTQDARAFNWDAIPTKANPATPAVGTNFTATCPAGKRWMLYGLVIQITTSAAGANRTMVVSADSVGAPVTLWKSVTTSNQTASRANYYYYWSGLAVSDAADQVLRYWPFPYGIEIPAGGLIYTTVTNIQAGDQVYLGWMLKEAPL